MTPLANAEVLLPQHGPALKLYVNTQRQSLCQGA